MFGKMMYDVNKEFACWSLVLLLLLGMGWSVVANASVHGGLWARKGRRVWLFDACFIAVACLGVVGAVVGVVGPFVESGPFLSLALIIVGFRLTRTAIRARRRLQRVQARYLVRELQRSAPPANDVPT